MKNLSIVLNVLLLIAVGAILNTQAQLSRATRIISECLFVGQLVVQPSSDDSGTNSFTAYAKNGTNYFGFDPTNAAPRIGIGGTNVVGISTNANFSTAASNKTVIIINGIITAIQ